MQENYQPVVLRKILLSKSATREEIEQELRKYNPDSESQSMTNTVLTVLQHERNQVIREDGNKFVINTFDEFTPGQIENLVSACSRRILTFEIRFFIALGPWSNWDHTLKNPPFRWGVNPSSASNVGVFNALRSGDVVYFYANQDPPTPFSNRGLFGVGKVIRKYDEEKELYWPDEKIKGAVIYKHRFEIESLKSVTSDSALLPWIDGLPFTKGLNRIANPDTLEQLIDNTQKIWNIDLNASKTNNWIWSVTPENWEIVKEKNIWASKIGQNIRDRVRPGDKVIFYVQGTNEFQGIFEFVGEWYDAPEPVWSDETDSVIYHSQIKLKPIKIGSVKVYDSAPELKMFLHPDDKRLINLVLKGGGGYPSNNGKPIVYQDYQKLLELMSNSNEEVNYWKISPGGAGESWENQKSRGLIGIHFFDSDLTGLSEDELRNKISEEYGAEEVAKRANTFGQVRNFLNIKEGDVIVANSGKSKILGVGRVVGPYKFRKGEEFPHTFPVDWYDTTEGTIPKQDGWMVTVIPLSKEEFENLTKLRINYLLLRHSPKLNRWDDSIGKKYHYGKIPNYTKLVPGAHTIWYDRKDGDFYYWGYGDIAKVENESEDQFKALFDNFTYFNDPKKENPGTEDVIPKKSLDSIKEKIMSLPGWNNQISMLPITKEIYDEIINGEVKSEPVHGETFEEHDLKMPSLSEIDNAKQKIEHDLNIEPDTIEHIITSLVSGKNVLLVGPVGTGKTHLAQLLPEYVFDYHCRVETATSDWTTHNVIGGIVPRVNGTDVSYAIQKGCVTETISENWMDGTGEKRIRTKVKVEKNGNSKFFRGEWLVIDEFNRANIDRAFGPLFTAVEYKELFVPSINKDYEKYRLPEDYRIIGTLNTFDKHYLFRLSDALKRRFAIIEIDIPKYENKKTELYFIVKKSLKGLDIDQDIFELDDVTREIKKCNSIEHEKYLNLLYEMMSFVRKIKPLGTAILISMFRFMLIHKSISTWEKALDLAFTSSVLPQLETLQQEPLKVIRSVFSHEPLNFFFGLNHETNDIGIYHNLLKQYREYLNDFLPLIGKDPLPGSILTRFRKPDGNLTENDKKTYLKDIEIWKNRPALTVFEKEISKIISEKGIDESTDIELTPTIEENENQE